MTSPRPFVAVIVILSYLTNFSHAQFPTPAPSAQCENEAVPFVGCLDSNGADRQACIDCFGAFANSFTSTTTCDEATSLVCSYSNSCASVCGNGNCGSYMEAYGGCFLGPTCFGSCSSTTPSSPLPAPSPSSPSSPTTTKTADDSTACSDQANAYASCVTSSGLSISSCLSCIQNYASSTATSGTCDDVTSITCGSAAACVSECGNCVNEQVALVNCEGTGTCSAFTCSSTPTAPSTSVPPATAPTASGVATPAPSAAGSSTTQCQDEITAFATCVTNAGQSPDSCGTCLTGFSPSTVSCSDLEYYTCGAMDACPVCGPCESEYTAAINCLNLGVCDAVTCTSSSTTTPSPPVPAPTTPAPANVPLSSPTLAVITRPTPAPFGGTVPTPPTVPTAVVSTSSAGRLPRLGATLVAVASGMAFTVLHLGL